MKAGDEIFSTDGNGNLFAGNIVHADPKKCVITLHKTLNNNDQRRFQLHLAVAPTKNIARYEWFLEKATEIGVDVITPLICEHSERGQVRNERLQKIIIAAAKQSQRTHFPILMPPVTFQEFLKMNLTANRFVAYVENRQPVHLKDAYKAGDCVIMIGPEGDFSSNEMQLALQQGFEPVSLGPARLRTETAAIVACHIVNLANE
jgi:16S rRNA (uracil1498-N3)-methyltransferase